jgi:ribonucleotide monophosphatase NagD (HAD superfamily)
MQVPRSAPTEQLKIYDLVLSRVDSLLVLTGVSSRADLDATPPGRRPTHVAEDLSGLFADAP